MPTFQSVSLHPAVQSRLLHPHPQSAENDTGDLLQRQPQNGQQAPLSSGVATPRALLTRSTQELVSIFSRGEVRDQQQRNDLSIQMEGIRNRVSLSMIAKTHSGRHISQQQKEQQQVPTDTRVGDCNSRPLVLGGTLTALQLWRRQRQQLEPVSLQGGLHRFSTGCRALDDLIAFPPEYTLDDGDDVGGGLPRGYVVQISGAAWKTQLALQCAAQVALLSHHSESVRYCFSTAGHSGYSLAQRYVQFLERPAADGGGEVRGGQVQFQPIATVLDFVKSLSALEEDWLRYEEQDEKLEAAPPVVLVLDSFATMTAGEEDIHRIQSLERWLKRLARQHSILVVCTGGGGSNSESADIQLEIQQATPTTCSIRLVRHPAKLVTEKDRTPLLHMTKFGMTTPE